LTIVSNEVIKTIASRKIRYRLGTLLFLPLFLGSPAGVKGGEDIK
jgi:hypothetical protein